MTDPLPSSQLQWPVPVVGGQLLRVLGRGVAFLWRRRLHTLRRGETSESWYTVTDDAFETHIYKRIVVKHSVFFRFTRVLEIKKIQHIDKENHLWLFPAICQSAPNLKLISDWMLSCTHVCGGLNRVENRESFQSSLTVRSKGAKLPAKTHK